MIDEKLKRELKNKRDCIQYFKWVKKHIMAEPDAYINGRITSKVEE